MFYILHNLGPVGDFSQAFIRSLTDSPLQETRDVFCMARRSSTQLSGMLKRTKGHMDLSLLVSTGKAKKGRVAPEE